jgi:hypothetical protein
MDATAMDAPSDGAPDASTDAPLDGSPPPTLRCSDAPGLQPGAAWPIALRCSARGGNTTALGPTSVSAIAWQALTDGGWGGDIVVAADGTIYAYDGDLVALASDGGTRWRTSGAFGAALAIGADGTLYSWSGALTAVRPDGTTLWSLPVTSNAAEFGPAIGPDGTIYVAGLEPSGGAIIGSLTAVTPQGAQRWQTSLGFAEPYSSPAVAPDGTIYMLVATTPGGVLYAFTPAGAVAWTAPTTGTMGGPSGAVAVGDDGTVYVTCAAGMCAFGPDGKPAGSFGNGGGPQAKRIVLAPRSGLLYETDSDQVLTAFAPDGAVAWSYVDPNSSQTIVAFADGRGAPYGSTLDTLTESMQVFAPDGGVAWSLQGVTPVAMGADGTVYGFQGNALVALAP